MVFIQIVVNRYDRYSQNWGNCLTYAEVAGSCAMKEIKSDNDQFQIDPRTIYEHCPISNDKRRISYDESNQYEFTDTARQLSRKKPKKFAA